MKSFSEFIHMGGYAQYVWPAYGIVAIVLIANIVSPLRKFKNMKTNKITEQIIPEHKIEWNTDDSSKA